MTDKLAFALDTTPERGTILPIPMSRDRWMYLAGAQNALRESHSQRQLTQWELDEIYRDIHP